MNIDENSAVIKNFKLNINENLASTSKFPNEFSLNLVIYDETFDLKFFKTSSQTSSDSKSDIYVIGTDGNPKLHEIKISEVFLIKEKTMSLKYLMI